MGSKGHESYEDWYDNGPGSENFKREMLSIPAVSEKSILKMMYNINIDVIDDRPGKSGKILREQIDALQRKLKADVKLSPFTMINKGLLEEIVKNGNRLLRYVEKLEGELRR